MKVPLLKRVRGNRDQMSRLKFSHSLLGSGYSFESFNEILFIIPHTLSNFPQQLGSKGYAYLCFDDNSPCYHSVRWLISKFCFSWPKWIQVF